jgi:hypothetical protein
VALSRAPVALPGNFSPHQQAYLHAFLATFHHRNLRLHNIPVTAPFTPGQRDYLQAIMDKITAGEQVQ